MKYYDRRFIRYTTEYSSSIIKDFTNLSYHEYSIIDENSHYIHKVFNCAYTFITQLGFYNEALLRSVVTRINDNNDFPSFYSSVEIINNSTKIDINVTWDGYPEIHFEFKSDNPKYWRLLRNRQLIKGIILNQWSHLSVISKKALKFGNDDYLSHVLGLFNSSLTEFFYSSNGINTTDYGLYDDIFKPLIPLKNFLSYINHDDGKIAIFPSYDDTEDKYKVGKVLTSTQDVALGIANNDFVGTPDKPFLNLDKWDIRQGKIEER